MVARREIHRQLPFAERIFSEILCEFCRRPAVSARPKSIYKSIHAFEACTGRCAAIIPFELTDNLARPRQSFPGCCAAPSARLRASSTRTCGVGDLPVGRFVDRRVESPLQKYFGFHAPQITSRTFRIPSHTEGRFAIVTDVGHGMRWTRQRLARDGIAGRVLRNP
jgi:hypothetical protein